MRAVFTVNLPAAPENRIDFPPDSEVLELVQSFGWELRELIENVQVPKGVLVGSVDVSGQAAELQLHQDPQHRTKYEEKLAKLFEQMPEIANEEKPFVIFYGYMADDQTEFVVTRMVRGQITFRLLHPELPRLLASTVKMVRKVLDRPVGKHPLAKRIFGRRTPIVMQRTILQHRSLEVANQRVLIYEKKENHIVFKGRVIPKPLRETLKTNKKDGLLALGSVFMLIPLTAYLILSPASPAHVLLHSSLERLSTALLTTALVSVLGLLQTYLDIRKNRIISWDFTPPHLDEI